MKRLHHVPNQTPHTERRVDGHVLHGWTIRQI